MESLFFIFFTLSSNYTDNGTACIMVSVLTSSTLDCGFETNIGICGFSAKHAALRRKSKDWLARNQNNVSEWSDMSTRGLLFQ